MIATPLAAAIAIVNATVINPYNGTVQKNQTVVVDGTRIQAVQPASKPLASDVRRIDATGKFLIPGLWDAHVHLTKAGVLSLPLFVANGVTSVRDMGSDFAEVAEWRKRIEADTLLGPTIRTSGQIIESRSNIERMKREHTVEPVDRIRIGVGTPAEGRAAVQRLAKLGVDHIKMRTTPDLATFQAVAHEAALHRLPLTAHPVATPQQMIEAGLGSVEHLLAFPPLDALTPAQRRSLFEKMKSSGMFMSETIVNFNHFVLLPYPVAEAFLSNRADIRRKLCLRLLTRRLARAGRGEERGRLFDRFLSARYTKHSAGYARDAGSGRAVPRGH